MVVSRGSKTPDSDGGGSGNDIGTIGVAIGSIGRISSTTQSSDSGRQIFHISCRM